MNALGKLGKWIAAMALAVPLLPTMIGGQEAARARAPAPRGLAAQGPAIASVEVRVRDLGTQEELEPVRSGGQLVLVEGQRVRLRMTAIPRAQNRGPRFPSARLELVGNTRKLHVERVNEELGTMVLRARSPEMGRGVSFVTFEVLEPAGMSDRMRRGRISIEVASDEPAPPPAPPRADPSEPEQRPGAVFYEHPDFGGRSSRFTEDMRDLRGTYVDNDSVSSIRVDRGCRLTLWEHQDFRGASSVIYEDVTYLQDHRVGNDRLSSVEVDCSAAGTRGGGRPPAPPRDPPRDPRREPRDGFGGTFYEHPDFRGQSSRFTEDVRDLRGTRVGNDSVSSIRVDRGCRLTLWEHQDFRGASSVIYEDVTHLRDERVGNDRVSSVEVDCGGQESRRGIALFDGDDYRGTEEVLYRDDRNLRDNQIGDRRVRSLRIDRGCVAELFDQPNFRGQSMVVDRDFETLRGTVLGIDNVSSVRVDCR